MSEKPTYEELEIRIKELENIVLENKHKNQNSEENNNWFYKVFENVAAGIAITDWEGHFRHCNPSFCDLLGYSMDELEERTFQTMIFPDDKDDNLAQVEQLKAGNLSYFIIENRYIHKLNYPVWVRKYVSALPDKSGRPSYLISIVSDISKEKGLEEKLLAMLSEAEKMANLGAWEFDIDKDRWTMSDNWLRIHGCRNQIMTTSELLPIAHPEDRDKIQKEFDRTVAEGSDYKIEHRIIRQDTGEERHIRAYGTAKFDTHGKAVKLYGAAQDMTDELAAFEALKESEERYRLLFENVDDAVYVHRIMPNGEPGKFEQVNAAARKMLGYTDHEFMCMSPWELDDPESSGDIIPEVMRELRTDRKSTFETVQLTKDKRRVHVDVNTVLTAIGKEEYILSVCRDITARKLTEKALQESEKKFRSSFENSAVGMAIIDIDGNLLAINKSACAILEYTEEELRHHTFLDITHEDDLEVSAIRFEQCLDDKKSYHIEKRYISKNDRLIWGYTSVSPIFESNGKFLYAIAHIQDITETKKILSQLEKRNLDLKLAQRIASIGTWSLDPEIGVPEWTDEIYRIYERDPKLGPHPFADYKKIYKGTYWERFNTAIQGAIKDGAPYDIELKLELPSGNVKWVHAICEPEAAAGPKGRKIRGTIQDITTRKQSEIKLKESEETLRQAQTLGKIGNWEFDALSEKITWSDEVFRLFERDPSKGPPTFDENMAFYYSEDSERLQKQVQAALEKGVTAEDDYQVKLPSGRSVWHHGKIFIRRNEKGETTQLLGTVQDITDRKKLEASLTIERKRLSMLLEAFPGFIYLQAPDYSVPFANQYFIEHFGNPRNRPCYEVLWNRETPCEPCHTFKVFNTKKPQIWEWSESPHGKVYMIHDYPFIDVNGSELVLEIGIDITTQKTAEMALHKEKNRLMVTLQSIGDGVITTDVSGNVVLMNRIAETLTGWKQTEARGNKLSHVFHIVDEHSRNRCENPVEKVLETDGIIGLGHNTLLISRNGTEKIIADSGAPIVDKEGSKIGFVLVFRDITKRINLETELRHVHKMEAVGNLAGGIAHEFNNVLTIIIGNAELAADDLEAWHPATENLSEIKHASMRAKDVVKQLLSFSRKLDIKKEPIDIRIIVRESLKFLKASLPSNIRIQEKFSASIDTIAADPTQIHQVLINLCSNAAHAMDEEGGTLLIELNNVTSDLKAASKNPDLKPGRYVKCSVSDTGKGIPPDLLDKIFDPYFTTKDVNKGTGMGLAVVHGIVQTHGGAITVESNVGNGAAFHIYLPSSKEKKPKILFHDEILPAGDEKILFVDDEPSIVRYSRRVLERLGYTVSAFTDPQELLTQFKSKPKEYDLVISDMMMPSLTGDRLAAELLKIRNDMPIILCTGYSEKISKNKAQEMGIKSLIMKPIDIAKLAVVTRNVLDTSKRVFE
jgi:PAS domain S-box-containing protein